jgi:hypothetical protein
MVVPRPPQLAASFISLNVSIGPSRHFAALRPLVAMEAERTSRRLPLQLQPRILSYQISSPPAVARSPCRSPSPQDPDDLAEGPPSFNLAKGIEREPWSLLN